MRFVLIVAPLVALAACSSESDAAIKQLRTIQSARGSQREVCGAERKVAAAYLKEGNTAKYRDARTSAETACLNADLSAELYR